MTMAKAKPKTSNGTASTATAVAEPEAQALDLDGQVEGEVKFGDTTEEGTQIIGVPQAIRPASTSMKKALVWVYGPPKIGKTTFAAQFPGVWFWATEPGQKYVTVHEPTLIHSWDHLVELAAWVEEHKPTRFGDGQPINTIAIDTVDLMFKMCTDYVSNSLGVEDPGELDHGKGWSRLSSEFQRVFTKMNRWPYTFVCISHARERELKIRGQKQTRIEPNIGAAGMRTLNAAADLIMYATAESVPVKDEKGEVTGEITEQRILQCHPTSYALAGGRMSDRLPQVVPLSYTELTKAFRIGRGK